MKRKYQTIDEYIGTFPEDIQSILQKIRQTVRNVVPEAVEAISYQIPTFKLNGRNLIHFAAWRNHISFYPVPSGPESFEKELSPYVKGRGTIQFPLGKPIPFDLVEKLVTYRVKRL